MLQLQWPLESSLVSLCFVLVAFAFAVRHHARRNAETSPELGQVGEIDRALDVHYRQLLGLGGQNREAGDAGAIGLGEDFAGFFVAPVAQDLGPAGSFELRPDRVQVFLAILALLGELKVLDRNRFQVGQQILGLRVVGLAPEKNFPAICSMAPSRVMSTVSLALEAS